MDPRVRNKNLPGRSFVDEGTLGRGRHTLGQITYVTHGSTPDVAAPVGESASCANRCTRSHVGLSNALPPEMRKSGNETKLMFREDLNRNKGRAVLFAVGAMGAGDPKEESCGGRAGSLLTLTDLSLSGACHFLSWGSRKTPRAVKLPLAAEICGASVRAFCIGVFVDSIPPAMGTFREFCFDPLRGGAPLSGIICASTFLIFDGLLSRALFAIFARQESVATRPGCSLRLVGRRPPLRRP